MHEVVLVNKTFSSDCLLQVGLNQGSVIRHLLFNIIMEVLSREIKPGCAEELHYIAACSISEIK